MGQPGVQVIGMTSTGRATVQALQLNRPVLVQTRRYWIALGLHPPMTSWSFGNLAEIIGGAMGSSYTEDALVEQPTIALFAELGWTTAVCLFEQADHCPFTGRETTAEVVLTARLRPALQKLNPGLPSEAYDQAIEQLTRSRSIMSMAQANHEVYGLLKEGVRVFIQDENGEEQVTTLRVIDWQQQRTTTSF